MTKRVAYIVGTLQTGGIERSVTDWCIHLKNRTEWQPVVICVLKRTGPFLKTLEDEGIEVIECKLREPGFVLRLRKLLLRINPDVVHSQVAFSMPWQVLGILLSGSRRIIFTQQNEYQNWNPLGARVRLKLYFLLFFRFIDHYTCVSEKVRDSLCALIGKAKHNFLIVPNSVNTNLFFPDKAERKQQREQLKIDETTFLAGVVARFSPQKGHHYLIEAAIILKEKHVGGKILLVGVGELESEIRELVSRHGLQEYIVFYGQALAVHKVLQALDCFILPSLWEGMPLALLEAMASTIPVIATDVAGTREVIKHNVNGLLIPSKDPDAIAEAFIKMKNSADLRHELAQRGLNFVRETYSVDANMAAYIKLYEG